MFLPLTTIRRPMFDPKGDYIALPARRTHHAKKERIPTRATPLSHPNLLFSIGFRSSPAPYICIAVRHHSRILTAGNPALRPPFHASLHRYHFTFAFIAPAVVFSPPLPV